MLVLSRKESQRIKLGDEIVVTVIRLGRDKVRLGIEAPSEIIVLREELELIEATDVETADDLATDDTLSGDIKEAA